jgi:hypothetical protein
MDLGPLIPIVAIVSGLGWGWLGLQHKKLKSAERGATHEADELRTENRLLADRVAVLERIVTDHPGRLSAEIEQLAAPSRSRAPSLDQ